MYARRPVSPVLGAYEGAAEQQRAAYVKNPPSSGQRHLWVFSVSPASSPMGSLSDPDSKPMGTMLRGSKRFMPSCSRTTRARVTPEKSEQRWSRLREMGFASYDGSRAIGSEGGIAGPGGRLGLCAAGRAETFRAMQDAYTTVEAETVDMAKVFEEVRTIPVNMRILASRLDDAGGPIDAIAINYGAMSAEMSAWLRAFSEGEKSVYAAIGKALWELSFLIGACAVQDEIARVFAADRTALPETVDRAEEAAILESLSVEYWSKVRVQLNLIAKSARTLEDGITNMKRQIIGLSSTRMMCKSESAILGKAGETLTAIVAHLDSIQVQIETRLRKMNEMTQVITGGPGTLTA